MKLRTGNPWMSGADCGRSLSGMSINLLVRQMEPALRFAREVLRAELVYADADLAVLQCCGMQWMLHADHCYDHHPMRGVVVGDTPWGRAVELRMHGIDPDEAEAAARRNGYTVLAAAAFISRICLRWFLERSSPEAILRHSFIIAAIAFVTIPFFDGAAAVGRNEW